ncbi:MAG: aldo/keto reductase [Acidobacteria bacterium]|nr:aldo/keto reductase [Acidobacteriota bacterium]
MDLSLDSKIKLGNGREIPMLGLGVYQSGRGAETVNAVKWALEAGYRHIDTAMMYGNEREVGEAVRESGIPREEIFVTTKLWNSDHGYDRAIRAFNHSLKNLCIDYIDLYLLHWPVPGLRKDSWRALETLLDEGKVKSIGVSNYTIRHIEELLSYVKVKPAVNQVEFHPFLYQADLQEYCEKNGIYLEAYSPLTKGKRLDDKTIVEVAAKHGKSPAQVMIRWVLQKGIIVLPKSANRERIRQNADVYDFNLDGEDINKLDSLNRDWHCTWDPTEEL